MSISGVIRSASFVILTLPLALQPGGVLCATDIHTIDAMSDQIKAGIESVVHVVSPRYDASVQSYLRRYLEKSRDRTEVLIGRSSVYFPIFEKELEASGLPTDLKYLAVVESALQTHAVSPVGATGLWQFMRPTARECGLMVTRYVDERCDPVKSTRAAIKYLSMLYEQFDSWELAMAAYNSGPGRVRYAIKRSGSRDYWKLQRYLPRETRSYVPGFIAASYVLNYYQDHGIVPAYPISEITEVDTVAVYDGLSFSEIQSVTRVPADVIEFLNPVYVRKFIPQSSLGHALILPSYAALTMQAYLSNDAEAMELVAFDGIETGVNVEFVERLVEETYIVLPGDNLYDIARDHRCSVNDLKVWNHLSGNLIRPGQRLKIQKMATVLVKIPEAPVLPSRDEFNISPLPSLVASLLDDDGARIGNCHLKPCEASYVERGIPENPVILRRRQHVSVSDPGMTMQPLSPGARLR